jgi:hypothetical protein
MPRGTGARRYRRRHAVACLLISLRLRTRLAVVAGGGLGALSRATGRGSGSVVGGRRGLLSDEDADAVRNEVRTLRAQMRNVGLVCEGVLDRTGANNRGLRGQHFAKSTVPTVCWSIRPGNAVAAGRTWKTPRSPGSPSNYPHEREETHVRS